MKAMDGLKTTAARYALRIDAMSVRERAIMFVSIAAALAALADVLVLSPQFASQRALAARQQAEAGEVELLRARLTQAAAPADTPQRRLLQQIAETRAEQATLDAQVQQALARQAQGAQLPDLLARVLRRHDRLTLLRLDSAAPAPTEPGSTPARRGVELQLAGRHADLVAYLAEIEQQLPGLRWADLHVDARQQPPVLSVRVTLPGDGA